MKFTKLLSSIREYFFSRIALEWNYLSAQPPALYVKFAFCSQIYVESFVFIYSA